MSRKDYRAIAQRVNSTLTRFCDDDNELHTKEEKDLISASMEVVVSEIADYLQVDNPRFDQVMFMEACGFTSDI